MAKPRREQDDGARGRELEMMRELAQIVSWHPARSERARHDHPTGDESTGMERQDSREGFSRRRPTGD
jgi:hypothetical protein